MENEQDIDLDGLQFDKSSCKRSGFRQSLKNYLSSPWIICKDGLLIISAMLGLAAFINSSIVAGRQASFEVDLPKSTPLGACNCGNSVSEALDMGCMFDSLAVAWMPPRCIDQELLLEFQRSGDGPDGAWRYFSDKELRNEISLDQLANMADHKEHLWYSTPQWHITHCVFYWRKQHRARWTGVLVEPRFDSDLHINHCAHILQSNKQIPVMAPVVLSSDYFE